MIKNYIKQYKVNKQIKLQTEKLKLAEELKKRAAEGKAEPEEGKSETVTEVKIDKPEQVAEVAEESNE